MKLHPLKLQQSFYEKYEFSKEEIEVKKQGILGHRDKKS